MVALFCNVFCYVLAGLFFQCTYLDENILSETFIINVRDGDKIEVKLTKDNDELNYVRLEENAYLEFEAF